MGTTDKTVDIVSWAEYETMEVTYVKAHKNLEVSARYKGLTINGDIEIAKLSHDLEIPLADIMDAYNADGSIKRYDWE